MGVSLTEASLSSPRPSAEGSVCLNLKSPARAQFAVSQHPIFVPNLTLGYNNCMTDVSKAASLMGRKSAESREKRWGRKEFVHKMQEWGKLGGRPKVGGKKKKRGQK